MGYEKPKINQHRPEKSNSKREDTASFQDRRQNKIATMQRHARTFSQKQPAYLLQRQVEDAFNESDEINSSQLSSGRLITDDATDKNKLDKNQFLAQLKSQINQMAAIVLKAVDQTPEDCPYLTYWFDYYKTKSAIEIETAITRLCPDTKKTASVEVVIDKLVSYAQQKLTESIASGFLDSGSLPLPTDLNDREVANTNAAQLVQMRAQKALNFSKRPSGNNAVQLHGKDKVSKAGVRAAEQHYEQDPSKKNLSEWRNQVRLYFRKGGQRAYIDQSYAKIRQAEVDLAPESEIRAKRESEALNTLVENSRPMNKYLTRNQEEEPENPEMEALYQSFEQSIRRIQPTRFKYETSQASRVPGMSSEDDLDSLTIGTVYEDPIIRFYGDGLVSSGKYLMQVNNLEAYDFTDKHTNSDYDQAVPSGVKEQQIVTLPGTRLRLVEIDQTKQPVHIIYEFVS